MALFIRFIITGFIIWATVYIVAGLPDIESRQMRTLYKIGQGISLTLILIGFCIMAFS